ncbi:hypothetical protein LSAT2_002698 [Lamellibrachia satsuma]|nr:hypothetical protein LSAT2_002698 [Lamellibrachia satsuma]
MTVASSTLTVCACVSTFIAVVLHSVAFATRHWLESHGNSPFDKIGFHDACFHHCKDPLCPTSGGPDVEFDGCAGIFDFYFEEIRQWLLPDWFTDVRLLTILLVPLSAICFIVLCVASCLVTKDRYSIEETRGRILCQVFFLVVSATLLFIAGIMYLVVLARFYLNAFNPSWMPVADKNHLGYSYWLEMATAVLILLSFVAMVIAAAFKALRASVTKDPHFSEDMMMEMR